MMKFAHSLKLGAGLCLGVGLIGCQLTPSQVKATAPLNPVEAPTLVDPAVVAPSGIQDFPAITMQPEAVTTDGGNVKIAIAWPVRVRNILALPFSANAVRVRIYEASGSTDLVNEIMGRDGGVTTASPGPNGGYNPTPMPSGQSALSNQVSVRRYFLKKNTAYKIEVKAYAENREAVTGSSVAVAYTTAPVDITVAAKENKAVPLTLTVPNPPTLGALPGTSGGTGAELTIPGTQLGMDRNNVQAYFITGTGDQQNAQSVEVLAVASSSVTVRVNNGNGQGKLRVYVDGIAANEQTFTLLNDLNFDSTAMLSNTEWVPGVNQNRTTFYVVKDATFSMPLRGTYWNNGQQAETQSVAASYSVTNKAGNAVSVTNNQGVLSLPQGYYRFNYTSGNLTKTVDFEAMALSFSNPNVGTQKVARNGLGGIQNWYEFNMPGLLVGNTLNNATQVYLRGSDYTWSYSVPGVVTRQGEGVNEGWAANQARAHFEPGNAIGTTQITASLKTDPSKTFSFNLMNVGIDRLVASQASVSVRVGESVGPSVKLHLTDDTLLDPVSYGQDWWSKFTWTSGNSGLATVAAKPKSNQYSSAENGFGIITGGALGSTEVTVTFADGGATTSIPVEITDDGRLNLTIQ